MSFFPEFMIFVCHNQHRKTMKTMFAAAILAMAMALPASADYHGKVFSDRNGDGTFDGGDRPLPGVMVTDGLNVVLTSKDGTYNLPGHDRERFVYVTVPSGYKASGRHYRRIEPGRVEYDFALVPYDAGIGRGGSHSFLQVADTEISSVEGQQEWVEDARRLAAGGRLAFIVHTGDICYEKGLKAHIRLMNTENMGVPVYYGIGNHDLVDGKYGEELFESLYGPVWYSFDAGNTHYVMTPMLHGDYRPSYTADDVARWLRNDLACIPEGTPVVFFNHDLLTAGDSFVYGGDKERIDLRDYNLKAWIYGHIHTNYVRNQGGVLTICSSSSDKGGIDHSAGAFRQVDVGPEGEISMRLRYPYVGPRPVIAAPKGMTSSLRMTVNVYSSYGDVESVTYSCECDGKTIIRSAPLSKRTDWSWCTEMPRDRIPEGKGVTVRAVALLDDGTQVESEEEFVYDPDAAVAEYGCDWTNLLGNASHSALADSLPGPLRLVWTVNVGANIYMTSPLVCDGKVYTASVDENMQGQANIYALDGRDGSVVWKYPVRASVKNTIAAWDGTVFAQDVLGWLYAVDAESGILKWELKLSVNDGLPPVIEGLAAEDGVVFAGSGAGLTAVDAESGEVLWTNRDWIQREGTTSTLSVGDGTVIGGVQWGALYCNDMSTGRMLWSHSGYGLRSRGASPAVHGHLLYMTSGEAFFIIDARSGEIIVRKDLPYSVDVTSTPLLTDGSIIFGTAGNGIVALDRYTLEEKWRVPVGDALIYTAPYTRKSCGTVETSPVLAGGVVYAGASDGVLYALDPDSGEVLWKYSTGAPVFGTAAVSGNVLAVSDYGGNVYVFAGE